MGITDTPTTAFENILISIVGPLPESKSGNLYIHTIKDWRNASESNYFV